MSPSIDIAPPEEDGWQTMEDGILSIRWMTCKPASEEVLELLLCDCRRKCARGSCECINNGSKCKQACRLSDCGNFSDEVDVSESDDSDEEQQFPIRICNFKV